MSEMINGMRREKMVLFAAAKGSQEKITSLELQLVLPSGRMREEGNLGMGTKLNKKHGKKKRATELMAKNPQFLFLSFGKDTTRTT